MIKGRLLFHLELGADYCGSGIASNRK